jgi:hypothetical protein
MIKRDTLKSIGAVAAGVAILSALAAVTDTLLQWAQVLPVTGEKKFENWQSLLALSYHLFYVVIAAYLVAALAPSRPVAHALAFGGVGVVMSVLGTIAIVTRDLAPAWYGWALIVLSLPTGWIGGKLFMILPTWRERVEGSE